MKGPWRFYFLHKKTAIIYYSSFKSMSSHNKDKSMTVKHIYGVGQSGSLSESRQNNEFINILSALI